MRNRLFIIPATMLVITFLSVGCKQSIGEGKDSKTSYSPEIEERINRIINNLQIETQIKDKYDTATLTARLKHYKTPGISIAVINNEEVEWARGFGVKEWGKEEKVDENTLFLAGSVSKPVFALGVMKLKEKGLVDLDEDINNYLTSWKVPPVNEWQPRVTLRQLLSHTAGFTVHGFPGYLHSEEIPSTKQILDGEYPSNTPPVRVNILPGSQFRYSGGGITIAQLTVSDLLEKPFPLVMQDEIFGPLKILNSSYEQPLPKEKMGQASTGHPWKYQPINGKFHIYPEMAAAGLWTTAQDLAKIGVEVQKAVKGKSSFIAQETIEEMLTPQKIASHIGMGFFLNGKDESIRFEHGGWDEGFVTEFVAYKKLGKGAVVMVNSNEGYAIMHEILRAIAIEYEWPDYLPEQKSYVEVNESILEKCVGKYQSESGMQGEIKFDKGQLLLTYEDQAPLILLAENDTTFLTPYLNVSIQFQKERDSIKSLTITQEGNTLALKKNSL